MKIIIKFKKIQEAQNPPKSLKTCCVCGLWHGIFKVSSVNGEIYDYWCEKHINVGRKSITELVTSSKAYTRAKPKPTISEEGVYKVIRAWRDSLSGSGHYHNECMKLSKQITSTFSIPEPKDNALEVGEILEKAKDNLLNSLQHMSKQNIIDTNSTRWNDLEECISDIDEFLSLSKPVKGVEEVGLSIPCDKCGNILTEQGALLFEPTDNPKLFKKTHICKHCQPGE